MVKSFYMAIYNAWSWLLAKDALFIGTIVERLWGTACVYCAAWRAFAQGFGLAVLVSGTGWWRAFGALLVIVVFLIVQGEKRYVDPQ